MTGAQVLRIGGVAVALAAGALFVTEPAWAKAVSASHAPAKSHVVQHGKTAKAAKTTHPAKTAHATKSKTVTPKR